MNPHPTSFRPNSIRRRGARPRLPSALLALAFVCMTTAALPQAEPKAKRLPNVVLVTLDTVRAASVGCYGYDRPTSPVLDELARTGTLFPNAISSSNWTHPTHISLFTGKHTFEHGARFQEPVLIPEDRRPAKSTDIYKLALTGIRDEEMMFAGFCREAGLECWAFAENKAHLDPRALPNLEKGFSKFITEPPIVGFSINEFAIKQMLRHRQGFKKPEDARPFFMFVNYMDAHTPYNTTPTERWIVENVRQDRQGFEVYHKTSRLLRGLPAEREEYEKTLADLTWQYDASIHNVDRELGVLIKALRDLGVYDDTMIVVTSDHGEFLGEHGLLEHVIDVYEEGVRIPLVIKYPGQKEGRVDERFVTSVDVPGMIIEALGGKAVERRGDRFPYVPGNHPPITEQYYTRDTRREEDPKHHRIRRAMYDLPWKLIQSSDGAHELYNLKDDPAEGRNLFAEEAERGKTMLATLEDFMEDSVFVERDPDAESDDPLPEPDAERTKQLKALGYL